MSIDFSDDFENICSLPLKERHSYFQLQYFTIGKEPTTQARLWRCVTELKERKKNLISAQMEIDETNDDLEIIDIKLDELRKNTKKRKEILAIQERKLQRRAEAKKMRLNEITNQKKLIEEECVFLVKAFKSLEKTEKLKSHDDLESQKQYWNEKLSQEFNLRRIFGLPPDVEVMKTILALNSDSCIKNDLLEILKQQTIPDTTEHEKLLNETKKKEEVVYFDKEKKHDI